MKAVWTIAFLTLFGATDSVFGIAVDGTLSSATPYPHIPSSPIPSINNAADNSRWTNSHWAHAHWTTVRGHTIYYEINGSGRPLLMLHGGGSPSGESFAKQWSGFAREHTVIAPEQVGQGHSPDVPGALSYRDMLEDTVALLRQLNLGAVDVVGWSDGGILALMLAAYHPELVGRVVISGANIDPNGLLDEEIASMRDAEKAASTEPQKIDSHLATATAASTSIDKKLRQLWLHSPTVAELNPALLQNIHKRVLVLAGDHDVIKLDHTLAIYKALPEAELSILPNTGHATFAEKPELVNPMVMAFLAQK